jgi:hypothetical protein
MHQFLKKAARKQLSLNFYNEDVIEENLIIEDQKIYADTRGWHAFEGYYDSSDADEWYLRKNKDIILDYISDNNLFNGNYIAQYIIADTAYFIVPLKLINFDCDDFKDFSDIDIESLSSIFHVSVNFTSKYWYERKIDSVKVGLILKDRYDEYAYNRIFFLKNIAEDNTYPDYVLNLTQKLVYRYITFNEYKIKQMGIEAEEFVTNYQFYLEVGEMVDY